ncbi:MAG: hypothetical protein OK442_07470 [Thaumarchaeota archaeon]|nr:hypothetical protein [Nitrososphaerota archaeon]
MFEFGFTLPSTLPGLFFLAVGLLVLWVVVSVPVYVSGELILGGKKASLGSAMGATLGGALVYVTVLYVGAILLAALLGPSAVAIALVLAIVAWLAVFRASFNTGWMAAIGIVAVAWVVLVVIDLVMTSVFGVSFPKFYPF